MCCSRKLLQKSVLVLSYGGSPNTCLLDTGSKVTLLIKSFFALNFGNQGICLKDAPFYAPLDLKIGRADPDYWGWMWSFNVGMCCFPVDNQCSTVICLPLPQVSRHGAEPLSSVEKVGFVLLMTKNRPKTEKISQRRLDGQNYHCLKLLGFHHEVMEAHTVELWPHTGLLT